VRMSLTVVLRIASRPHNCSQWSSAAVVAEALRLRLAGAFGRAQTSEHCLDCWRK